MKNRIKYITVTLFALLLISVIVYDGLKSDYKITQKSDVAMGTVITACIYSGSEAVTDDIIEQIKNTEKEISKNISDSYVSLLNSKGFVQCDEQTAELFNLCNRVYEFSGGAFDITTGGLSLLWDIGGEKKTVPTEKEINTTLKTVDGNNVKVNENTVSIRKGQTVDLGAIGKGYGADKALDILKNSDVKGAVISVGGSILLYGKHNRIGDNWSVAVRNPFGTASDYAGILNVDDCFVSTSGTYERYFENDGKRYHHILSPFDGYPVENGLESVTVISNSGALSDALSTAAFVLGIEKGMELIKSLSQEAVFIDSDKNVYLSDGIKDSFVLCSDDFNIVDYENG